VLFLTDLTNKIRKPFCRKETTRCRRYALRFKVLPTTFTYKLRCC